MITKLIYCQDYKSRSQEASEATVAARADYLSKRGPNELAYEKYRRSNALKKGRKAVRVLRDPSSSAALTGYTRYVIQEYPSAQAESESPRDVMKIIARRWKDLSEEERKVRTSSFSMIDWLLKIFSIVILRQNL